MRKKKILCVLASILALSILIPMTASAEDCSEIFFSSEETQNEIIASAAAPEMEAFYNGNNKNTQNYIKFIRWATPIDSYLTVASNGRTLRFQNSDESNWYLAEYYDSKFNRVLTKFIPKELDIFGGFYNAGDCYILVTGQKNPDESDSVEVLRITKYDTNWNKLSYASLYGANTATPFIYGCVRFCRCGDYLLLRTSHDKYRNENGINHQANMTVQYDIYNSAITDYSTHTANDKEGYISHSLNQFITVEDGRIVAVDHGDAYPRSIALVKYQTDARGGKFKPDYCSSPCSVVNVLKIPGTVGDTYTGMCLGGFEVSNSHYLIAGNTVADSNDYRDDKAGRNVFISAVDKKTNKVKTNYITNYKRTDVGVDNPQFTKISDDRFIVLWTERKTSKVNYVEIDGSGKKKGSVYSMSGDLSDCKPEMINGELVWYVWQGKKLCFNSINASDISKNSSIIIDYDIIDNYPAIYGDMDNNNAITSDDSLFVLRASVGLEYLTDLQRELADVDGDKNVSSADALDILRCSVSLPSKGRCGKKK